MSKHLRIWLFVLLSTLLTSTTLLAEGVITMTTARPIGEKIFLTIEANGNLTIEGVKIVYYANGGFDYILTSQKVTIRGDVTKLNFESTGSKFNSLTSLDVSGCPSLTELNCEHNYLTSLNVSNNTALTTLDCSNNRLTSLNVSGCTALTELDCRINQLPSLNVSGCTALTTLYCLFNQLPSLDVSDCTSLEYLNCYDNQLTSLNVSGCTSLKWLDCEENQRISLNASGCTALTELDCNGWNLKSLDVSGCTALTMLQCYSNGLTCLNVSGCTALTTLYCPNNQLTSLDVSGCTALTKLNCYNNQLTNLDVSGCIFLTYLECSSNNLATLDVTGCYSLESLYCEKNQLTSLNILDCPTLWSLRCSNNQLSYLDLSKNTGLGVLYCVDNQLTSLNLSGYTSLTELWCKGDQLTSLNVSGCTALTKLDCNGNQLSLNASGCTALKTLNYDYSQLTSLDVSGCTALTGLYCRESQLTSLNASGCTALTTLYCWESQLTKLDASGCTALTDLGCSNNPLTSINLSGCQSLKEFSWTKGKLTSLDVSDCTSLTKLNCYNNQLTSLDLSSCTALITLNCGSNQLTSLDFSSCTALTTLNCGSNQLTSLDLSSCTALTTLNCGSNQLTNLNVSSYTSLTTLNCSNNQLTSLDLSGCTALTDFDCGENPVFDSLDVSGCTSLTKLDCKKSSSPKKLKASGCTALTEFYCRDWSLISLDVSGCTSLIKLICPKHYLTNLNASGCTALKMLDCSGDSLTNLNLSGCTSLTMFFFINNRLVSLNISGCTALTKLACSSNQLTSLDASGCTALKTLDCRDNKLTSLNVSGCTALKTLDCSDNTLSDINLLQCFELNWLRCSINQIKASAMTALINSLPDRQGKTVGMLQVVDKESTKEGNLCFTDHVTKAKAKNWQAQSYQSNAWSDYAGSEVPTFAVTSSATTGGMVAIIGAPDLTKVRYDTELTIVATPAEGYALTALTANGTDILASKKVTVKEALEVKATFTKKAFAVTLSKEGEGTISATGASNLNAVAYGTELTIVATPATGYELVSITAGGTDITASKKVVVTGNLIVKATFAKKSFAVTFAKEGEGSITATGASSLNAVDYGTELKINATPAEGYELVSITAGGTDITASKKIVVKDNLTIKATFAKKTFAVTLTHDGEGKVDATGAEDLTAVPYGTELTIKAMPKQGYELTALTVNGKDILATRKVLVTESLTIKATFAQKTFAVTLDKEGEGVLDATGADDLKAVPYGTKLTIIATPAEGYALTGLLAGGADITDTKKVVVTGNLTVKATFTKKNFAVSLTKEGEGTISATGADNLNAVAYGTELTIVATPAEGYELVSITAGGTDITATKKIVVKEALEVKATFTKKNFAVSLTKEGEGTISAIGATSLDAVAYGTELTIVATPAEGYELTALTANGTDILATKKVVVEGNLTVKAIFTKKSFAVSLTKEGEGTITATGATSLNAVAYGTELTIVATPAEGYELTALTAKGTDITATKKIVVKDNMTVKATFAKKNFAVTLTKEGEGKITATGASNLNSVAYGTELTIVATPATGYELVSITAGGTDITATKKVVVTGNLTVKATFAKKSFAVTFDKVGEGTISATGASNLNSVAYGTELTIVATPAEGYELVSITAGGVDITTSKKVVVKDNVTVKATFAKKNFSVSLTKEGEGTITATGASNLNSVAYGTELTINARPAEGYELVSITAGGTDITASKKIVVKDNVTVKATFAKKAFAVSLTKEGEGMITATGASNLNSVAYGTELTINATPAEGYELTALTANGTDILATKKIVVTDNLTVKATFTKKTFAVTLTSNEHGKITIVEPVDLDAVPYGTTLTVKATGKNAQCVLTALTANGEDILATQSFVVTDVTEVKATFVDHTGVETTVTQQVKLYPNPATDYVIVEGVAPASEVTLHSMTGERLYAGRADSRGVLQIDLTPYADGVYLVCIAGETYRVVVRR